MKERMAQAREYMNHEVVAEAMTEQWGCDSDARPKGHRLTDNSDESREFLETASSEYLSVSNPEIAQRKKNPATSIKAKNLPDKLSEESASEIYQSLWQKEDAETGLPRRGMLVWDIEKYDQHSGNLLVDQMGSFESMEPQYKKMREVLDNYGIDITAIMTGRGYHFLCQITDKKVLLQLSEIGGPIEEAVKGYQAWIPDNSKRDKPISLKSEQIYLGALRLQQFVFNKVIKDLRKEGHTDVDISDVGEKGVSFDNTAMNRHIGSAITGVAGSLYAKPIINPEKFGVEIVDRTRLLTRVVRNNGIEEYWNLNQLIEARQNFDKGIENLEWSGGTIPDASTGVQKLIADYKKSDLHKLHTALDDEPGDPPQNWDHTYRNYEAIAKDNPDIAHIIYEANPKMLQPESLKYLVNTLFDRWGGNHDLRVAGHVRGFLQAVYEDGRFNWGERFTRHEIAARHATGWVTNILGERYT